MEGFPVTLTMTSEVPWPESAPESMLVAFAFCNPVSALQGNAPTGARDKHDGERLVGAPLERGRAPHRVIVTGVHHEVDAAEPLDGDDATAPQRREGRREGGVAVVEHTTCRIPQRELRPAGRAGV